MVCRCREFFFSNIFSFLLFQFNELSSTALNIFAIVHMFLLRLRPNFASFHFRCAFLPHKKKQKTKNKRKHTSNNMCIKKKFVHKPVTDLTSYSWLFSELPKRWTIRTKKKINRTAPKTSKKNQKTNRKKDQTKAPY